MSENLNSSESLTLADGSYFSAFLFKITIPIPFNHENTQIKNPVNNATVKLFCAIGGTKFAFKIDPALDIVKVSPNAKFNSLPLNH
jgi:hypothetical protein